MLTIRKSDDRGKGSHGWLDSRHSFSFANYYDPACMGFSDLRVINEDWIAAGGGFPTHPHADMEIVTYVVDGALEHRDSLGTGSVIRPGDVQRMSAGTGIRHSEFNGSKTDPVHLLQIWIEPGHTGLPASYEQKLLPNSQALTLIGSADGRNGSVTIHQDVALYRAAPAANELIDYSLAAGRHAWLQMVHGEMTINGVAIQTGDGLAITDETQLAIKGMTSRNEALLFDLR